MKIFLKFFTWWTICGPNDGIKGWINESYNFWQYDTPYSPISYQVIRTPKSAFEDVSVEEGHYLYVNYKGQDFRVHYLDEGQCDQIFMKKTI